jgi:broad specificity phosphatase PhoE
VPEGREEVKSKAVKDPIHSAFERAIGLAAERGVIVFDEYSDEFDPDAWEAVKNRHNLVATTEGKTMGDKSIDYGIKETKYVVVIRGTFKGRDIDRMQRKFPALVAAAKDADPDCAVTVDTGAIELDFGDDEPQTDKPTE